MRFPDLSPSTSWAALKFKGVTVAEVWFKPEGDPWGLTFRIPRASLETPGLGNALSAARLLNAVAVAPEDVESWRLEGAAESTPDLDSPLPPPAADSGHLLIHVSLKPDHAAEPGRPGGEREERERLQDLEARWRVLLALESSIESMRLSMDAIRAEMEATAKRPLTTEEKLNALQADVVQLARAKNRVHYTLPKAKEFIHRATWMPGAPERKQLEEVYAKYVASPETNPEPEQVEAMIKDRQNFIAQGKTVHAECRSVITNIQTALRTLQANAAANARKKRPAR